MPVMSLRAAEAAAREPARAELIGGESVEVAIVGAGVAGLSLALHSTPYSAVTWATGSPAVVEAIPR